MTSHSAECPNVAQQNLVCRSSTATQPVTWPRNKPAISYLMVCARASCTSAFSPNGLRLVQGYCCDGKRQMPCTLASSGCLGQVLRSANLCKPLVECCDVSGPYLALVFYACATACCLCRGEPLCSAHPFFMQTLEVGFCCIARRRVCMQLRCLPQPHQGAV